VIDFSVCIETAFAEGERAVPDRVRAAADAGFPAVEIWDWQDKSLPDLSRALVESNTKLHTLCVETWRDKCQLADPQSHDEFIARVERAASVALELGTPKLVVLGGDAIHDRDVASQRNAVVDALARASDVLGQSGIELVVEVVNRQFEGPNALLQDSAAALEVICRVDRPNVRFLHDRYHAILNGEPLGWAIDAHIDLVGHVQAADVPGRHEFGTGNQNWAEELAHLIRAGYEGYVGIEIVPAADSAGLYAGARSILLAAQSLVGSVPTTSVAISTVPAHSRFMSAPRVNCSEALD
jgi:hydroxypyruvate isomerase